MFLPYDKSSRNIDKMGDDINKGILLSFVLLVCYLNKLPNRIMYHSSSAHADQTYADVAERFNFKKSLIQNLLLHTFAIAAPILGAILYHCGLFWMFFSVLVFGFFELIFNVPSYELAEKIKYKWIVNPALRKEQTKQIKLLLWLAIAVNFVLFFLNTYPFVLSYEGGVCVTLLTVLLCLINCFVLYYLIKDLRIIDDLIEDNICKFACEEQLKINSANISASHNAHDRICLYQQICQCNHIPLKVLKANIRISNAMIYCYKKMGTLELSFVDICKVLATKIESSKRDFIIRECRIAIEILNLLEDDRNVDDIVKFVQAKYRD